MPKNASQRSRRQKSSRNGRQNPAVLSNGPSYQGQPIVRLTIPGFGGLVTTTVTTGVAALTTPLTDANIPNFVGRFGSTFDEYRILGCDVKVRPLAQSTGITSFWFDEKSATLPVSLDAKERIASRLPNSNANPSSFKTMSWKARDLLDLEFSPIGVPTTPAYFKSYTNAADYGAPIVATNLWYLELDFRVEFRGLKSV